MSDRMDRFSKRARRVLELAQTEALRLNHDVADSEHILLGLARVEDGVAAQLLHKMGVEPDQLIRAVERTVGRGQVALDDTPTLTPDAKLAIELAVDEARLMGHHYVGTEHLLLGILRLGNGIAVNVLRGLNVDFDALRALHVREILGTQAQLRRRGKPASKSGAPVWPRIVPRRKRSSFPSRPRSVASHDSVRLDRFTKRARRTLALAQEEALRLNQDSIEPEHILLGLAREEHGSAAQIFQDARLTFGQLSRAVEQRIGHGDSKPSDRPVLAPSSTQVIEYAVDEASKLGTAYVGTEHLLLGLLRENDDSASGILRGLGITPDSVRAEAIKLTLQALAGAGAHWSRPFQFRSTALIDLARAVEGGEFGLIPRYSLAVQVAIQALTLPLANNVAFVCDPPVNNGHVMLRTAHRLRHPRLAEGLAGKRFLMAADAAPPRDDAERARWTQVSIAIIRAAVAEESKGIVLLLDNLAWLSHETGKLDGPGRMAATAQLGEHFARCDAARAARAIAFAEERFEDTADQHAQLAEMEAALADFCEELADPAFLLHALLSLGRLQAVGALTSAEQQWATAHDPLFSDLFSVVHVTPPEVEEVITILDRAKLWPEERYRLRFPQETLEAIARVVLQLGQTRTVPDAAVDLLSAVAGHLRRSDDPALPDARQVQKELAETQQQKEQALDAQRYDDAIDLRYQEVALEAQLEAAMGSMSEMQGHMEVTPETVALVYAEQSGLPLDTVLAAMATDG